MGRAVKVALNGEVLDLENASLPVTERGLLYGDGIFETLRLYGGRAFAAGRHHARMVRSAKFLSLPAPPPDLFLLAEEVARLNGHQEGAVRITLTRKSETTALRPDPNTSAATTLITTRALPEGLPHMQRYGVAGRTLPYPLRAEGLTLQNHKTINYLPSLIALRDVPEGEVPILETTGGNLSEAATSNIFWVKEGTLYTPALSTGALPGIAREIVLELAARASMKVAEVLLPKKALLEAEEAFLTNSLIEAAPLTSLDGAPIGSGAPGEVTRLIQELWAKEVLKDVGGEGSTEPMS
ncbi:MAG: hypothetical protein C0608_01315 [Deltaproteobacteria bacterium]|nr:MAG: hypothetical protein C0608_01315 [Deltaproteobacteria bacterium]